MIQMKNVYILVELVSEKSCSVFKQIGSLYCKITKSDQIK